VTDVESVPTSLTLFILLWELAYRLVQCSFQQRTWWPFVHTLLLLYCIDDLQWISIPLTLSAHKKQLNQLFVSNLLSIFFILFNW
jgi:hypothetical protein